MIRFSRLAVAAFAVAVFAGSAAQAEGDAEKGKKVYNKCKACHVIDSDKNRVGPNLQGIFGRTAGAVEGFKYSDAMMDSGIVWDETTIAEYLTDPKGYIPGNRMAFPGLRKEADVANVIAYMKEASAQ